MPTTVVVQAGHLEPREPKAHLPAGTGSPGEADFNETLRDRLVAVLRADDRFEPLPMPGDILDGVEADGALFLHADGVDDPKARGFHFGFPTWHESSTKLVGLLRSALLQVPGHPPSRGNDNSTAGLRQYYGYALVDSAGPKVVVEHGFVSNPLDRHWLYTNVARIANAEYEALCAYFGHQPRTLNVPERTLQRTQPELQGADVKVPQLVLSDLGFGQLGGACEWTHA
jgi:hypothetical protein